MTANRWRHGRTPVGRDFSLLRSLTELFETGVLTSARDVMIVRWLVDSGVRVGGLCGLRFGDLHLTRDHPCGQRKDPHVHIVGREDNPNRARAKSYYPCGAHPRWSCDRRRDQNGQRLND